jgi:site-specific recombinase XerD
MTFNEVMRLFLRSRELGITRARKQATPSTIKNYQWDLRHFWEFMESKGKSRYEQIDRGDMLDFLAWIQAQDWAVATRLKVLRSVRALFNFIEYDEECREDGLKAWKRYLPIITKTPRRNYIPTPIELRQFKAAFDTKQRKGHRDFVAFCVMAGTGIRLGELVSLPMENLNLVEAFMLVSGKTGPRIIPLSSDLVRLLRAWLRRRDTFAKCNMVFVTEEGTPCSDFTIDQSFAKMRKVFKLSHITPHTLRHVFCTYYLKKGGNMAKLRAISGHSSYEQLKDYEHLAQIGGKEIREELERVNPLRQMED